MLYEEQESIGAYLRRQRKMRQISLDEIARETKISLRTLRALEGDDYKALPGNTIAKGFVRSYAKVVGINPTDAMLHCEEYMRRSVHIDPEAKQKFKWMKPSLRIKPWVLVLLGSIASVLAVYWTTR